MSDLQKAINDGAERISEVIDAIQARRGDDYVKAASCCTNLISLVWHSGGDVPEFVSVAATTMVFELGQMLCEKHGWAFGEFTTDVEMLSTLARIE